MAISINDFNFDNIHLLKYVDDVNKDLIPLIAIEVITRNNYLKYDSLMFKHYGKEGLRFLKLVLMFNDKNDISDIKINERLLIPDIVYLCENLELIESDDYTIVQFSDLSIESKTSCDCFTQPRDRRKTKASTRLNIIMEQPRFDDESGKIIY